MENNIYSLLLPPPNLTGYLHLGHMWNAILQDVLVRHHESSGKKVRWFCGVDHAGLSLQIKVEENLRSKGIEPSSLSPDEFDAHLSEWAKQHREIIIGQYSKLNLLLPPLEDWRYTLDDDSRRFVEETILILCRQKLIYRAKKLVNWDPSLRTVVSDSEIVFSKIKKKLYRVKYFFRNHPQNYVEVDTTRPETLWADLAVTIHPQSPQYVELPSDVRKKLESMQGEELINPVNGKSILLFFDQKMTKPDFGTGAVKRTPAHDPSDYRWWEENIDLFAKTPYLSTDNLPELFAEENSSDYMDKSRLIQEVFDDLFPKGQIQIVDENYPSEIPISSKTGCAIENILSRQIFLNTTQIIRSILTDPELNKTLNDMNIFPKLQRENLMDILENTKDWCISRQIRWGFKVFWETDEFGNLSPNFYPKGQNIESLDTWFSSGLWNLICNPDLSSITTIISGKDILFPWISKMIFLHLYLSKHLSPQKKILPPFKNIYLHGLVLDSKGRKMSKSLNNGIDPLDLMEKYDMDQIRLAFLSNTTGSNNFSFSTRTIEDKSKFMHKLRNSRKFVDSREERFKLENLNISDAHLNQNELWFLGELSRFTRERKRDIESFSFSNLANRTSSFVWDKFCNCFLEVYRLIESSSEINNTPGFLTYAWDHILTLLYPIIPNFVSEAKSDLSFALLNGEEFTQIDGSFSFFYEHMRMFTELRKHWSIPWSQNLDLNIYSDDEDKISVFLPFFSLINQKVRLIMNKRPERTKDNFLLFSNPLGSVVEVLGISNKSEYIKECGDRVRKLEEIKKPFEDKLSNPNFVSRASSEIVDSYREILREYNSQHEFYSWIIKENII